MELYKNAFNAEVLCAYEDEKGGYLHAELNVYGHIIAIAEAVEPLTVGNTMQFCFHYGENGSDEVKRAYEILKDEATVTFPMGECMFSPLMFGLIDKFGVNWCIFV